MKLNVSTILLLTLSICALSSCKKTEDLVDFTEEDEIALGEILASALAENPNYKVIPSAGNSIPYGYATSRLLELVSTSSISKGEDFTWNIYLLDNDERQAFAFPGGHIYVTTGMIFFLDNEDQFSGLLAHFIAHIDQSHISETLFFKYGINGLKTVANGGNSSSVNDIINDLDLADEFLTFTRGNEIQADTLAISMLSEIDQTCDAVGLFYNKTLTIQTNQQSKLIAAHQLDLARIESINEVVTSIACDTTVDDESDSRYQSFRNSLP